MCRTGDVTQIYFILRLFFFPPPLAGRSVNGSPLENAAYLKRGMGNAFLMVLTSALFCLFFCVFALAAVEKDVNGRVAARSRPAWGGGGWMGGLQYLAASLKTAVRLFVSPLSD